MDQNEWNKLVAQHYRNNNAAARRKNVATAILALLSLFILIGLGVSAMLIKSGLETKAKYEFSLCCETPNDQ